MSILNVNRIQPVGSGQTVTINAANISAGSATLTAGTFSGNLSGNVNSTGITTATTLNATSIVGVNTLGVTTAYVTNLAGVGAGTSVQILSGSKLVGLTTGSITYPGAILQVVQTVKTDTFSVTGGTLTDVTGFAATITPSSTSNKVLVLVDVKVGSSVDYGISQRITRNGTAIYIGDTAGNRPRLSNWTTLYAAGPGYNMSSQIISYLDSPASTSALTYKLQLASYGSNVSYVNRNNQWQNTSEYDGSIPSSITLMEVAG